MRLEGSSIREGGSRADPEALARGVGGRRCCRNGGKGQNGRGGSRSQSGRSGRRCQNGESQGGKRSQNQKGWVPRWGCRKDAAPCQKLTEMPEPKMLEVRYWLSWRNQRNPTTVETSGSSGVIGNPTSKTLARVERTGTVTSYKVFFGNIRTIGRMEAYEKRVIGK